MTPTDRLTLARKLEFLRKQLTLLEEYQRLTAAVMVGDVEKRYTAERLLELSIQSVVDCSRLLVAVEDWRELRDDRDALLILAHRGVIDDGLAKRLLRAKGFRNILVHEYVEIDPDLVCKYLQNDVADLWTFNKSLAMYVQESGRGGQEETHHHRL